MSYLPELRDALHSTAARHAGQPHARRRPRWRTAVSRTALIAAVLPSIALTVFILTSIHTAHNTITPGASPTGPPAAPAAWVRAQRKAAQAVFTHDRGCRSKNSISGPQRMLEQAPGRQFTSVLGVLRQPAPVAARVTAARIRQLHVLAQDIYIRYVRHGVIDGVTYYLIPAAKDIGGPPLSARCVALELTAFAQQATQLPRTQRPRAIAWERQQIRQRQQQRAGVVLLTFTPGGGQGGAYRTLSDLRTNPFMGGGGGTNDVTTSALLLPNRVATVTAHYGTQTYPGRVSRPVTVTRPVVNNLVIFVFRGAWDPPQLTYRSANGTVLWSTPRH